MARVRSDTPRYAAASFLLIKSLSGNLNCGFGFIDSSPMFAILLSLKLKVVIVTDRSEIVKALAANCINLTTPSLSRLFR